MQSKRKPEISVIVPARDSADTILGCLEGLLEQSIPRDRYEVIVVDDGSTDNTAELAEAAGAHVIRTVPRGPAAARNAGAQAAVGGLLVFMDSDCTPSRDFLARISAPFADMGLVGAKGTYRTHQRAHVSRFVQQEYQHKYDRMSRWESIDFIDTYAAAYRRDVFLANGGFDASFTTASVEDQEFSFRLARMGYKLRFQPEAIVYHRHDRTLGEYLRRKLGIGYWKAYLLRWHPERLTSDTHTPFAQRLQVGLILPLLGLALLTAFLPQILPLTLVAAAVFCLSAVRELWTVVRRDPALALIAPLMVFFRALALALGLAAGVLAAPAEGYGGWRPLSPGQRWSKRVIDILASALGLALSTPLMLLAAVAIKLDSPGPALFLQERVGEGGRRFRILKLRTMVKDAVDRLPEVLEKNALQGPAFKIPDDPRVTRVGRFLRRWSLDEIPQLWNVLRGEMSLVGPRPEEVGVVERYEEWHRKRLAVPPGITGPMQVSGRGALDLDERVRLEVEYIQTYSVWRDLAILLRTGPAVISGEGAL